MRHGSLFSGYGGIDRAIADVFGDVQRMLDGQTDDYAHLPGTKETRP